MTTKTLSDIFLVFILLLFANCTGESVSQLYYEEAGSGETILFVHGAQEDYRVFLPQVEALSQNYRVITYSRKYNYQNSNSYQPGDTFNVFTEAEDLEILLDALDTESVHLAGHSYGGLIAMAFAGQHPNRVKSLILSEPPLLRLPGCEDWFEYTESELIQKGKAAYETGDSTRVMSAIFEFFTGADIQDQVPPEFLQTLYENLPEMVAIFYSDDPFPDLSVDSELPLLFITAGNTMPMLECTNNSFLQRYPQANHYHLSGADHNLWMTHPKKLSVAVQNFLSNDREYPFIQHIEDTSRLHYGYLTVLENHANPAEREIEIAWAVIKSKDPTTEKYPLIFLTGGPGGETLPMISLFMNFPLTDDRDVILFDQRGIGHSSPLPNFGIELPGLLAADLTPEEEYQKLVEILHNYREKSDSMGIGLQHYNTFQNARDIVSLMDHLGYEKYNIMGGSFGTRLARVVMDLSPEVIHSAILDSPNPFDNDFITSRIRSYEQALNLVLENCAQDRYCSSTYPDLKSEYFNGVQALKDEPVLIQTDELDFYVNAQDAIFLLRYQLYRDNALEGAPALIRAIAERDKDHIKENLLAAMPIITDGNYSMFLSTERFEHYDPAITRQTLDELYSSMQLYPAPLGFFTSLYLASCSWHGHSAEPGDKSFNLSDIPTLIFVNKYDPVTPPANGHTMNETLTSGHLLILDEGGHGGGNMECKMNVIREFMDNPSVLSGIECLNLASN